MNTYQQYLSDCDAVTDLKNKLKHAEKNKSECEQRVIEQMALQGFDRLTTRGKTIYQRLITTVKVLDKEALKAALKEQDAEHISAPNAAALKSYIRELLTSEVTGTVIHDASLLPGSLGKCVEIGSILKIGVTSGG